MERTSPPEARAVDAASGGKSPLVAGAAVLLALLLVMLLLLAAALAADVAEDVVAGSSSSGGKMIDQMTEKWLTGMTSFCPRSCYSSGSSESHWSLMRFQAAAVFGLMMIAGMMTWQQQQQESQQQHQLEGGLAEACWYSFAVVYTCCA